MGNYAALIVDDEHAARDTLNRLIDWRSLGFSTVDFAANGEDALRAFSLRAYDIVLTDIEMPILDGIGLIAQIRKQKSDQKIVIISCHEKFEYARDAIRLGVNDYLIKDLVTPDELRTLICSVVNRGSVSEQSNGESKPPVSIRSALTDAAAGKKPAALPLADGSAVMCLVVDNHNLLCAQNGHAQTEKMMESLWSAFPCVAPDLAHPDRAYAFFAVSESVSLLNYINGAITTANTVRQTARKLGFSSLSIGISDAVSNAAQLPLACKQACEASELRILNGLNKTNLFNSGAAKLPMLDTKHLEGLFSRFEEMALNANTGCIKIIDSLYAEELPCGFAEVHYYHYLNTRLWAVLVSVAQTFGKSQSEIFESMGISDGAIERLESTSKKAELFKSFLLNLFNSTRNNVTSIVDRAIMLIENEYQSDISLNYIADALHTHKGYLCRTFKEETGENIMQYIVNKKIERAKYLLDYTQMRLYEISESLAFATPQYFSHVFKKHTGMSPIEYKKGKVSEGRSV